MFDIKVVDINGTYYAHIALLTRYLIKLIKTSKKAYHNVYFCLHPTIIKSGEVQQKTNNFLHF